MITQHLLARAEPPATPRLAHEIAMRSRELARSERRLRQPEAPREHPAPNPTRARRAWAWARALTA